MHAVAAALREQPERLTALVVQESGKPHPARDTMIAEAKALGIPVRAEPPEFFDELAPGRATQGIAVELSPFPYADLQAVIERLPADALIVLLDGVTDPHNLGSILRTSAFFGAAAVVIPKDRSVEVTPTVEKTACGGAATVAVCQVTNLTRAMEELKRAGFWVYGTVVDAPCRPSSVNLEGRVALVLGSEGDGLRRLVRDKCDVLLSVPPSGSLGSLNVGVFAGVAMYEWFRQRGTAATEPIAPNPKE